MALKVSFTSFIFLISPDFHAVRYKELTARALSSILGCVIKPFAAEYGFAAGGLAEYGVAAGGLSEYGLAEYGVAAGGLPEYGLYTNAISYLKIKFILFPPK
jgi:hypothetical protein